MKKARRPTHQGYVFYRGPSLLDGNRILGVATGFRRRPKNRKTGPMIQGYVLRADTPPVLAAVNGNDFSVCGNCPLRTVINAKGKQERPCYEILFHGPRAVWDAAIRGTYQDVAVARLAELLAGLEFRIGAYGDPAAILTQVWEQLTAHTHKFTAYTHQWRTCDPELQHLAMASVETLADREAAKAAGWRTFRTRMPGDIVLPGEIVCPASEEAGKRTQCIRCGLCNGVRYDIDPRKDITTLVHGQGVGAYRRRVKEKQ